MTYTSKSPDMRKLKAAEDMPMTSWRGRKGQGEGKRGREEKRGNGSDLTESAKWIYLLKWLCIVFWSCEGSYTTRGIIATTRKSFTHGNKSAIFVCHKVVSFFLSLSCTWWDVQSCLSVCFMHFLPPSPLLLLPSLFSVPQ